MATLKQRVVSGLIWRSFERVGTQGIGLVISMFLARLLGPEEYGTIALLTIFMAVSNIFVDSGFGKALIQRKNVDSLDFNSIFYFNLFAGCSVYCVLFLIAPAIAAFYGKPILVAILRVLALNLVLGSLNCVQNAILIKEMRFNLSFFISLAGIITNGVVGIALAWAGHGVWALVYGQLSSTAVSMLARWVLVGWRPGFSFSFERLRSLFSYSSKLLCSEVLDTFFNQVYGLLIGKIYTPSDLAFFNRGDSLPGMIMGSVQGVIGSVAFPAMASIQEKRAQMKQFMRRALKASSFLAFPVMVGLAVVARPLVSLWLSDKWLPAVPYLQISCVTYAFWPIHVANLQAIQACGRSDIFLRLEIIKKAVLIVAIALTFRYGVFILILGRAATAPIGLLINTWPNRKLIDYSLQEQFKDVIEFLLLAVGMGLIVSLLSLLPLSNGLLLCSQILLGAVVYTGGCYLFASEMFQYVLKTVREAVGHGR